MSEIKHEICTLSFHTPIYSTDEFVDLAVALDYILRTYKDKIDIDFSDDFLSFIGFYDEGLRKEFVHDK